MLKELFHSLIFLKKRIPLDCFSEYSLMVRYLKFFTILFIILSGIFYSKFDLKAESLESQTQIYLENANELNAKKRKGGVFYTKSNGREIKSLTEKESVSKSQKEKKNIAAKKMIETGVTTKNLVKKNRWFVKKPFQESYNKISRIKRFRPRKFGFEKNNNVSLKAFELSKTRSRDTGAVKPDSIFSGEHGRSAQIMSKTQTRKAGPTKPGPIYSENSGRVALDISKNRARALGPVKPEIIYSEKESRDAMQMTLKKNKRLMKIKPIGKGPIYSAELIRSMGRKPPIKNIPFHDGKFNSEEKGNSNPNTGS